MKTDLITAPHIYPLWYYVLGVITVALIPKLKRRSRGLNEIERITKLKA